MKEILFNVLSAGGTDETFLESVTEHELKVDKLFRLVDSGSNDEQCRPQARILPVDVLFRVPYRNVLGLLGRVDRRFLRDRHTLRRMDISHWIFRCDRNTEARTLHGRRLRNGRVGDTLLSDLPRGHVESVSLS